MEISFSNLWHNNVKREQTEALQSISQTMALTSEKEIKARDRVNITLEDYEKMKNRISRLEWELERKSQLLNILNFPPNAIDEIDMDSVEVYKSPDLRDFVDYYQIKFCVRRFI